MKKFNKIYQKVILESREILAREGDPLKGKWELNLWKHNTDYISVSYSVLDDVKQYIDITIRKKNGKLILKWYDWSDGDKSEDYSEAKLKALLKPAKIKLSNKFWKSILKNIKKL